MHIIFQLQKILDNKKRKKKLKEAIGKELTCGGARKELYSFRLGTLQERKGWSELFSCLVQPYLCSQEASEAYSRSQALDAG